MLEEDLTNGEKLFLKRRRAGKRRWEYARQYGVSRYTYHAWEKDVGDVPIVPTLNGIDQPEHFTILRKRAGLNQTDLAERMGISRSWLYKMEHGKAPLDQAIEFWCR